MGSTKISPAIVKRCKSPSLSDEDADARSDAHSDACSVKREGGKQHLGTSSVLGPVFL